jgi:Ion channel
MTDNQMIQNNASSEVFRYGGAGTILLLALLAFVAAHPLFLGTTAARIIGGLVLVIILVSGTLAASKSLVQCTISGALAILVVCQQIGFLLSGNRIFEMVWAVAFALFCIYTAIVILRRVLSFGPIYADRVHAALSVYILIALAWAGAYGFVELVSPGAFSTTATAGADDAGPQGAILFTQMVHLSIATLTSTGYGDITPIAPFARSLSQLEQLVGVFYMAVLISRLVGLYPMQDRSE